MKLVYVKRLAKSELKLANWKLGFQFSPVQSSSAKINLQR